jgi:small-conductance mechanosensitive channel
MTFCPHGLGTGCGECEIDRFEKQVADLTAQLAARDAQIELLKRQVDSAVEGAQPLWSGEVDRRDALIAKAREVLKFYGERDNYAPRESDITQSWINCDDGIRARSVLAEMEGK